MVTNQQVRRLMKLITQGEPLATAALKAGMDEKTARKYREAGQLPSEIRDERGPRHWRTHPDAFAEVWDEVRTLLEVNPGLQAKTLFQELQRRYPGQFQDGQLRAFQRKVKVWRALEGSPKEVFFPQEHHPGQLAASDFCHLTGLAVTLQGRPFPHLLYHFVLTYSNWETGSLCFSESFESLAAGLQQALWELGGVPQRHRTDSLSAAVQPLDGKEGFTRRYAALLAHYGLTGEAIQPGKAHENGDVEQRHHRFKVALDQALLLRGSRDFESQAAYAQFVRQLFTQLNAGRRLRLQEERAVLRPLPATRLDVTRRVKVKVGPSSTIRVLHNTYSVPSRLIGEAIEVRVALEHLELWYASSAWNGCPGSAASINTASTTATSPTGWSANPARSRSIAIGTTCSPPAVSALPMMCCSEPTLAWPTGSIWGCSSWRPRRRSKGWTTRCGCCWPKTAPCRSVECGSCCSRGGNCRATSRCPSQLWT